MQKFFGPQFLWERRLRLLYGSLLGRLTTHYLAKFGWVPFADVRVCEAWQWSRMQNLRTVGKNAGRVWSRLWTKVHDILGQCRRHLVVVNALDRLSISCFIPKIYAIKVAVKLRSRPKRWFLGPRFVGGGGIPDFGHAFVNYTYFRPCGRFSFSSVQRSRRSGGEKKRRKKKKKEETLVKYKSADILCRAA